MSYERLPTQLHELLRQKLSPRQQLPAKHAEFARVEAYWHIGRIIVEQEQDGRERADYATELVESLSHALTAEYGPGYAPRQLWLFKQFYLVFPILRTSCAELETTPSSLRRELTWSHYRLLIRLADSLQRNFYLHAAADEAWSVRALNELIHSRYYEQTVLGEDFLTSASLPHLGSTGRASRRTRLARARRVLLNLPGWAYIARRTADVPLTDPRPDLLFYHYRWRRLLGIWLAEPTAPLAEAVREQLRTWQRVAPPGDESPLGLLADGNGRIRPVVLDGRPLPPELPSQL